MGIQCAARVLILDNDPRVGRDLQAMLDPLGYRVQIALGTGQRLLEQAVIDACAFRPHVAIVDLRMLDDYSDDRSGFELLNSLRSARCILYSAYLSPEVTREALRRYSATSWVSKSESPKHLLDEIAKATWEICASHRDWTLHWPSAWTSQRIVETLFGRDTDVPLDTVEDVLGQLFPENTKIKLETVGGEVASSPPVSQGRSSVFKAWPDGLEPVVVKLAPAKRIRSEAENYRKHIQGRLVGQFYAHVERTIEFWDLGGTVYRFMGSSLRTLPSFTTFYRNKKEPAIILKPLDHFFTEVWSRHYRSSQHEDFPLFRVYDQALNLKERLERFSNQKRRRAFPGLPISLIKPVPWVLRHAEDSLIPGARQAITHGDLHGDNLFTDGERAWAIEYERSGPGHILRDFVELEVDVVTRLVPFPEGDFSRFYELAVVLAEPAGPKVPLQPTTQLWKDIDTRKALEVISGLRKLAHEVTFYSDSREYVWGLLLNALLVASLAPEESPQRERALLLGSVLCGRLMRWGGEWPPPDWPPVGERRREVTISLPVGHDQVSEQPQIEGQEAMISPKLRSDLVDALCRVPLTTTMEGRTVLLRGILGTQNLTRSMNSRVDLIQIIKQVNSLGRLESGDWPVMMLIDNALAYVEGTDLAQELQAIRRTLEGTIQQTLDVSVFFEKAGFTVQVLSGTSLSVRCPEKASWRRYGEIYVRRIEDDVSGADVRAMASRVGEEKTPDRGLAFLVHSGRLVEDATRELWASKQKGLVIVPLHIATLSESLAEPPQVCYARLRSLKDGWSTLSDPYGKITSTDPQWFVGRQQRIRDALDSIEQSKAVGIFGGRRYGKTVFLNQLDSACFQKGYPVTYLVCTRESFLSDLLGGIAEGLVRCARKLYPKIELPELSFGNGQARMAVHFQTHMTRLRDALSEAGAERPKCVVLLDEIDNIVPEEESPEQVYRRYVEFFQAIKGVAERAGFLSLAVAGYSPAILNRKNKLQGQPYFENSEYENPMYDRLNEIRLPLMTKGETDELVQNLGALAGLEYPEPSLQAIYQEGRGHPEVTRKLCSSILEEQVEQGRQPGTVVLEVVDMAIRRFLSDPRQTFYLEETYWNLALERHPALAKLILHFLAKAPRSKGQIVALVADRSPASPDLQSAMEEVENTLTSLEDLGLVSSQNGQYSIVIPLLWRWIRQDKLKEDPFVPVRRQSDV